MFNFANVTNTVKIRKTSCKKKRQKKKCMHNHLCHNKKNAKYITESKCVTVDYTSAHIIHVTEEYHRGVFFREREGVQTG